MCQPVEPHGPLPATSPPHWALPNPATGGSLRTSFPPPALGLYTHASYWKPSLHLSLRLNPGIISSKKTSSSFPYQNLLHYIVFACLPTQLTTKLYFLSARTRRSSLDPQVQHRTSMKAMSGYVHLNEWQILPNKERYLKVILMGQPVSSKLTYVIEASSSQMTHVVYFYLIFGHAARHARS